MTNEATVEVRTVAVVGGDASVGRAIGQLLSGIGYGVRLLPEPIHGKVGDAIGGVGLLILAPALSAECREALARKKLPILELPWPCTTEELKRSIEAALGD